MLNEHYIMEKEVNIKLSDILYLIVLSITTTSTLNAFAINELNEEIVGTSTRVIGTGVMSSNSLSGDLTTPKVNESESNADYRIDFDSETLRYKEQLKHSQDGNWNTVAPTQCGINVEAQLTRRKILYANVLGFHLAGRFDPTRSKHFQGIQRYDHHTGSYLYLTQDTQKSDCNNPGRLAIVRMGSRAANGMAYGNSRNGPDDPPPLLDFVIDTRQGDGFSSYCHPGGMAIYDNVLAVAMEGRLKKTVPTGRVDFYQLHSPERLMRINSIELPNDTAASVGFTQDAEGHLLVAIADNKPREVMLYRSTKPGRLTAKTRFKRTAVLSTSALELPSADWLQNVDLIRDCNSDAIYMVAAYRRDKGRDRLMRYRLSKKVVKVKKAGKSIWRRSEKTEYRVRYSFVALGGKNQVIHCSPPLASHVCTLNAGFGTFISPEGRILYYASERQNKGPFGSTEIGEFIPG